MDISVADRAYKYLRTKLARGEMPPGTRLVTRQIADAVQGSLSPVREAITRLVSEGLVAHFPGGGAYVKQPSQDEVRELYDVRAQLEAMAVELALPNLTANQVDGLRAACQDMQAIAERSALRVTPTASFWPTFWRTMRAFTASSFAPPATAFSIR